MNNLAIRLIKFYQRFLSPDQSYISGLFRFKYCKHLPTCSEYSIIQFEKETFLKATVKTIKRIIGCNPFT